MKTLLLLLLTCLPLCAATTYPMLSDTTNRTVTGGVTNMSLLNANQTFTGTNTFPAASFYPANNIGMRLLWSSPTNIYLPSIAVSSALTNNGDFVNTTYIGKATLPALLGLNSSLVLVGHILRTNANTSTASIQAFVGSNTNFVGGNPAVSTTVGIAGLNLATHFLQCANSSTLQIQGSQFVSPLNTTMTSFTTTSSPFELYLGAMTATSHTNLQLIGLKVYELYAP